MDSSSPVIDYSYGQEMKGWGNQWWESEYFHQYNVQVFDIKYWTLVANMSWLVALCPQSGSLWHQLSPIEDRRNTGDFYDNDISHNYQYWVQYHPIKHLWFDWKVFIK